MADYDDLFDLGVQGDYINTVVEIPKGSTHKVEYDREHKVFVVDRVEPAIFAKPVNYGFIPRTTDDDGDALDTLIITEEPLPTGVVLKAKVIGVLNFIDDGENDYKIVCVHEDDRHTGPVTEVSDQWKRQIEHHFNHYKDLKKPGSTKVEGWGSAADAWTIIANCAANFGAAA